MLETKKATVFESARETKLLGTEEQVESFGGQIFEVCRTPWSSLGNILIGKSKLQFQYPSHTVIRQTVLFGSKLPKPASVCIGRVGGRWQHGFGG